MALIRALSGSGGGSSDSYTLSYIGNGTSFTVTESGRYMCIGINATGSTNPQVSITSTGTSRFYDSVKYTNSSSSFRAVAIGVYDMSAGQTITVSGTSAYAICFKISFSVQTMLYGAAMDEGSALSYDYVCDGTKSIIAIALANKTNFGMSVTDTINNGFDYYVQTTSAPSVAIRLEDKKITTATLSVPSAGGNWTAKAVIVLQVSA